MNFSLLFRMLILVIISVLFTNFILENNKIRNSIISLITPLTKFLRLPYPCVFSFVLCFFNSTAGKSALANFYKNKEINDIDVILTIVMSTFSTVLGEYLLTAQALITIAILGLKLGIIYLFLNLFSSFLQLLAGVVYIHKYQNTKTINIEEIPLIQKPKGNAIKRSIKILKKTIPTIIVTFFLINFLLEIGGYKYLNILFSPFLKFFGIPGMSAIVIIAQLIHFSAGYTTVATLFYSGTLTLKQALITLLLGSMAVITSIYLKYTFPMYIGLFGKFGIKVGIIDYMASIFSKFIMIFFLMFLL